MNQKDVINMLMLLPSIDDDVDALNKQFRKVGKLDCLVLLAYTQFDWLIDQIINDGKCDPNAGELMICGSDSVFSAFVDRFGVDVVNRAEELTKNRMAASSSILQVKIGGLH